MLPSLFLYLLSFSQSNYSCSSSISFHASFFLFFLVPLILVFYSFCICFLPSFSISFLSHNLFDYSSVSSQLSFFFLCLSFLSLLSLLPLSISVFLLNISSSVPSVLPFFSLRPVLPLLSFFSLIPKLFFFLCFAFLPFFLLSFLFLFSSCPFFLLSSS